MPWVLGLLNHFNTGTGYLANVDSTANEHVDVEGVFALDVSPGRNHQKRARHIADTAWAHVPLGALGIHERIGVAEALTIESHSAEQGVVHRLLVEVGVLRIV